MAGFRYSCTLKTTCHIDKIWCETSLASMKHEKARIRSTRVSDPVQKKTKNT